MKLHQKTKRKLILALSLVTLCICTLLGFASCASYHADRDALAALVNPPSGVTVEEKKDQVVFLPEEPKVGFIFYPGAKVDYEAYAPLLSRLAEEGVLCVDIRMPLNYAFLGISKAEGIQKEYPEVTTWYVGGHSLGGAMVSSYLAKHSADYAGLLLLASYSTSDLSHSGLNILSIYGSEDKVLNQKNYEKYRSNLGSFSETVIEGGCHAYFGSYGAQKGDGEPTISKEQQIETTVSAILTFLGE